MWRQTRRPRFIRYGNASITAADDGREGKRHMPSIFRWHASQAPRAAQPAPPRTDEDVRLALRQLPHYRVLLHNDDHNSMDHVVMALLRIVARLTTEQAVSVMLEAHTEGVATVIVCPKETAEFYREGLERYGLTSTIEPL